MDDKKNVELLTWQEVRASIKKINPHLADIIDAIDPKDKYKIVKINYRYGDCIVDKGAIRIPNDAGKLCHLHDDSIDKKIQEQLEYSKIPLSFSLNKANEIFLTGRDKTFPLNVIDPGMLFGLFETMDYLYNKKSTPVWSVSSGCRTVFTLPRISEKSGFKRLRIAYKLPDLQLKDPLSHFHLFKAIAQHVSNNNKPWMNTVLLFGKHWFDHKKDKVWHTFFEYLFGEVWMHSKEALAKRSSSMIWQSFMVSINQRNLKPEPYFADTVKNALLIAEGAATGFMPVDDSELTMPSKLIQRSIKEVYMLKQYHPTIMQPSLLKTHSYYPVYYSLTLPIMLEGTAEGRRHSSTIILELRDIKRLIDTFLNSSISAADDLSNTFEYFHVADDTFEEILPSILIPEKDTRFKYTGDEEFCATSYFWRGVISVSKK